jgi:uncharacterized protein YndB with AHSA1/START domain
MRILRAVGVIIVLLIVVVVGVGLAVPEFEYENRITIDRPAEVVWPTFTDASRMKEWLADMVSAEVISGKHLEVGSRWKFVFDSEGERVEVIEQVTAVEPNARYAFDMETEPFTGNTDIRLVPQGAKTELVATTKVVGRNVAFAALMRVFRGSMIEQSQKSYDALKRAVESGP